MSTVETAIPYVFGGLALVLGMLSALIAYRKLRQLRAYYFTAKTSIGDVTSGVVHLEGQVQPASYLDEAPITGEESVCWAVTELRGSDDIDEVLRVLDRMDNTHSHQMWHLAPFRLIDETGEIRIDPTPESKSTDENGVYENEGVSGNPGQMFQLSDADIITCEHRGECPEAVEDLVEYSETFEGPPEGASLKDAVGREAPRRYVERTLAPGDTVTVVGEVDRSDDGRLCVKNTDLFTLTDDLTYARKKAFQALLVTSLFAVFAIPCGVFALLSALS